MKIPRGFALVLTLAAAACSRQAPPDADVQAERDQKFEAMMTNVSLVGHSTMFGKEGISGQEEYVIDKVSRVAGDRTDAGRCMARHAGDLLGRELADFVERDDLALRCGEAGDEPLEHPSRLDAVEVAGPTRLPRVARRAEERP